jgi:RHS repeat-associated protein
VTTPHSAGYYNISETYWPSGALHTLGGVGLPTITYNADGEGRPTAVSASTGQNPVTGTSYNVRGQVTGVTLGSGDVSNFAFDNNTGRQTFYNEVINGSSVSGTLIWNSNATLKQLSTSDAFNAADTQTCNYTYDDLTRLASANCGTAWSQTFSYDAFSNLTKNGSITWNPGYNTATNRYTLGGTSYDSNGNLLTDTFHTYKWNIENRPTNVDTIALIHDAFGRIVEKNNSGAYNQYVYDAAGNKLATMTGQTLFKALVSLPGRIQAVFSPTASFYRIPDWLGSARIISTSSRTYSMSRAFAPFGERYALGGSAPFVDSFTGVTNSTVSDEYDFFARSLQTSQGRWISPDPAGLQAADPSNPQSWNRYAYALNNPLKYKDPLGLYCQWDDGTRDDEEIDGGAGFGDCGDQGGTWIDSTTITVNGDNPGDVDTIENGQQLFPETIPFQQSYFDCVKNSGNYFSLQHGLQAASGGRMGDSWVSGALLGNPFSDLVEFGEGLANGNGAQAGSSGSSGAFGLYDPAGRTLEAATQLQDVTVVTANVAVTTVQIPGVSMTSVSVNAASKTIPLGTLGSIAKPVLSVAKGLNVWNYGVSAVSAFVCGIGE